MRLKMSLKKSAEEYGSLILILAGLIAFFGFTAPNFLSLTTLRTIANQVPDAIILAVGMTLVLISGGIDLSVGSVLALSSAILGVCLLDFHLPLIVALAACLLTGVMCGAVNGLVTVNWKLPSFIVTLGMLEIGRGGAYWTTHSQTKYLGSHLEFLSAVSLVGISLPFLFALLLVGITQIGLTRTVYGRYLLAIGANEEAARYSGISPGQIRIAVFTLCGLSSAIAGIIQTSRLSASDPNAGTGAELQAIAASVIGGTSLMGGRGSILKTFSGVLLIAILGAGLSQLGVQEATKRVITGGVIVIAVIFDYYRTRNEMRAPVKKS